MTEETFTYTVKCRTCRAAFQIQLFDSHQKNLFVVDKKDWYCETCKQAFFRTRAAELSTASQAKGFLPLTGTLKMVNWAEKIRSELIGKAEYLRQSLKFDTDAQRQLSDTAFDQFFSQWQAQTAAKWWIDHRKMTVRDMSKKLEEIKAAGKSE